MKKIKIIFNGIINYFIQRKLTVQYSIILVIMLLVFLLSFIGTNWIATSAVQKDAVEYSDKMFQQILNKMDTYYEDMDHVVTALAYSPTIVEYMKTDSFEKRWSMMKDLNSAIANSKSIRNEIKLIALYDKNDNVIASSGEPFIDKPNVKIDKKINYTNALKGKDNNVYFGIIIPIYNLNSKENSTYMGTCFILVSTDSLKALIEDYNPTTDSMIILTDQEHVIIAQHGMKKVTSKYMGIGEKTSSNCLVREVSHVSLSWVISSIVPKETLFESINLLQKINVITYICIFSALVLLVVSLYKGILQPIKNQVKFMQNHTESMEERMIVNTHNEIGTLAETMNYMLDKIDVLNQKILYSQKKQYELEIAKKHSEMLAYRSQINPHFLYNTFECIRGMALYHDNMDLAEISQSLAKLFRYTIKGEEYATIQDELSNMQEYAKIIRYRFMDKYQITVNAPREILYCLIPKMIIQPLIENAVLHGLEPMCRSGKVSACISQIDSKMLKLVIEDDGCGMQKEQILTLQKAMKQYDENEIFLNTEQGIGFINTYRRIRLFYGEDASVSIHSQPEKGTKITIFMPMM